MSSLLPVLSRPWKNSEAFVPQLLCQDAIGGRFVCPRLGDITELTPRNLYLFYVNDLCLCCLEMHSFWSCFLRLYWYKLSASLSILILPLIDLMLTKGCWVTLTFVTVKCCSAKNCQVFSSRLICWIFSVLLPHVVFMKLCWFTLSCRGIPLITQPFFLKEYSWFIHSLHSYCSFKW